MRHPHVFVRKAILLSVFALALLAPNYQPATAASSKQPPAVVTISAASFEANALAPGAIVSAFGVGLATRTEASNSVPLLTALAGTTVRVKDSAGNERAAGLFFVSAGQINFVIPETTATGAATLTVQAGDGTTSMGTLDIKAVAPAIFTANANGVGVPAAVILRARANGEQTFENAAQFDAALGQLRPRPIDLSPAGDRVFLLLFFTGTLRAADPNGDGNRNETVRLLLGGTAVTPDFAGPQGGLVGLDQMNIELPRGLIGNGRVSLSVTGSGLTSNLVEVEIASPAGAAPPAVSGFNTATALAGQTIEIQGNGFAGLATDNVVRIGGVEAQVVSAAPGRLSVIVPYGVETGVVSVRTPLGEGRSSDALRIRTSLSGLVENTERQPLKDVVVRVRQASVNTSLNGAFVLGEPVTTPLGALVEIDGTKIPVNPPYGLLKTLAPVVSNRDNQFARPFTLQQINGASAQVGGNLQSDESETALSIPVQTPPQIQNGNVTLGLPVGMQFKFPDGATSGVLTLTRVEGSRTPINLPLGVFSSTIIQITPFGTQFTPGARLTFPNSDGFPAGAALKLFRLDQTPDSPTLGRFVQAGTATVSADGQTINAPNGSVPEATYYFVSLERATTTVIGRVLDSDRTPLRRALVRVRGQEDFTDGNGGFVLRNVPVNGGNDPLTVEASLIRANGRVDRALSNSVNAVSGGVTDVGTLTMPPAAANQPPIILIAPQLTVNAGQTREFAFVADDPDSGQPVRVTLSGASFASIIQNPLALRLAPSFNDVGSFTLTLIATDNQGATTSRNVAVTVLRTNRAPVANSQAVTTDEDIAKVITLTGSDPDGDALNYVIVANPQRGVLSGSGATRTYTPSRDFNGADSFTFRVNDGALDSNTATVAITINPVNDAPVLTVPGTQTVQAGQTLTFTVSATDVDAGQTLTYSAANLPAGANFSAATRTFTWTPAANFTPGQLTVNFTVTDNGTPPLSDTKVVQIVVTAAAFALRDHRISSGPFDNVCTPPPVKTSYLPTDAQVFQWTLVNGAAIGDQVRWDFIQPSGAVYATSNLTLGLAGAVCFRAPLNIAGQPAAQLLGNWQVRVFYKGALLVTDTFTISASSLNIDDARMSPGPIPDSCVPPVARNSFTTADARAYHWSHVTNGVQGDPVRWDFIQPDGAVYFTFTFNLNFSGDGCFWAWIDIANGNAAGLPGNWQVRVFHKGLQVLTTPFTISAGSVNVLDHRTSLGPIPANCVPPAAKTSFLTTDAQVYQWTNLTGASSGDTVRWDFIQPNGAVYLTQSFNLDISGGVCFWLAMNLAGQPAAGLPGAWQVRVYYKNALIATDNFTISRTGAVEEFQPPPRGGAGQSRRAP